MPAHERISAVDAAHATLAATFTDHPAGAAPASHENLRAMCSDVHAQIRREFSSSKSLHDMNAMCLCVEQLAQTGGIVSLTTAGSALHPEADPCQVSSVLHERQNEHDRPRLTAAGGAFHHHSNQRGAHLGVKRVHGNHRKFTI